MLRDKMNALLSDLYAITAEREELLVAMAIALLTRKNLFILGDVGQAKSFAIDEFRKRITGARQFERLLSKQVDEEQIFGRVDLSSLIPGNADPQILEQDATYQRLFREHQAAYANCAANGTADSYDRLDECNKRLDACQKALYSLHGNKPKIITTGKIPDSHIVFLDELFKASDGILNSLLKAFHERRYTNEGETVEIPTITFFAASNEIPNFNNAEESILKALYDRLEIKVVTKYIEHRDNRLRILKDKQTGSGGQMQHTITLDELYAMQDEVKAVAVPDAINELMDTILCELRDKGIHVSDRKYFGYYPIARAYAWLQGRKTVEAGDLLILKHYLWTTPNELDIIQPLLERKCINPLKEALDDILAMAADGYEDFVATDGADTARRIGKLRDELIRLYESLTALKAKAQSDEEIRQIESTVGQLEEYSRKAHDVVPYTYAPLNELLALKIIA